MLRESNIPLFLWIAAALLVHLTWKDGADRASAVIEERLDLQRFAAAVQQHVRLEAQPMEVTLIDDSSEEPSSQESESGETSPDESTPEEQQAAEERQPEREEHKKAEQEPDKPEEKAKPTPEDKKKKKEALVEAQKKKEEEDKKREELPQVETRNRIAVQQHVENKTQEDNPEAEFIANEANRVKEQTQARITSTMQNDPSPTPGGNHSGPNAAPGNAEQTRVAQDEDSPGVPGHAPNERTGETTGQVASAPAAGAAAAGDATPGKQNPESESKVARQSTDPSQRAQQAEAALRGTQGAPEIMVSPSSSEAVAEAQRAQRAERGQKAQKRRLPPPKSRGGMTDLLGFGAAGTTKNGINLNLTPTTAVAAIGRDKLMREKRADAERRRSQHLGSWRSVGIERWRAAIENYVSSVKPGNQTALNTARVPFASYLNVIHNRLHPIFADSFLASLDSLPGSHPMNQEGIRTNLEIVLSQEDGRVVRMGVTRTSGVTAFDIAALEAVQRASPFGAPPREIVSPDGNVYFHWEFHRHPYYACSTYFARPYILKARPKTAPPQVDPPAPNEPVNDEQAPQRHGSLRLPGTRPVEPLAILR